MGRARSLGNDSFWLAGQASAPDKDWSVDEPKRAKRGRSRLPKTGPVARSAPQAPLAPAEPPRLAVRTPDLPLPRIAPRLPALRAPRLAVRMPELRVPRPSLSLPRPAVSLPRPRISVPRPAVRPPDVGTLLGGARARIERLVDRISPVHNGRRYGAREASLLFLAVFGEIEMLSFATLWAVVGRPDASLQLQVALLPASWVCGAVASGSVLWRARDELRREREEALVSAEVAASFNASNWRERIGAR